MNLIIKARLSAKVSFVRHMNRNVYNEVRCNSEMAYLQSTSGSYIIVRGNKDRFENSFTRIQKSTGNVHNSVL